MKNQFKYVIYIYTHFMKSCSGQ